MIDRLAFDSSRTAVLAMDFQQAIVNAYVTPGDGLLDRAASVLAAARAGGFTVIHVRVGFRPGMPEISARNALFGALKASPERRAMFEGSGSDVATALGPEPSDIVVTKRRVSAFWGTDLDLILRARDIETLVLFGIATSGVVLSTLLDAVDADYRCYVVGDGCLDGDSALHDALLTRLFPKRAPVITSEEFRAATR